MFWYQTFNEIIYVLLGTAANISHILEAKKLLSLSNAASLVSICECCIRNYNLYYLSHYIHYSHLQILE